jgi:general secretion pathway protein G
MGLFQQVKVQGGLLKKVQMRGAREWASAGVLRSYVERVRRSATKQMGLFQQVKVQGGLLKKVQMRGAREWASAGVLRSYVERVRRSATMQMGLFQQPARGFTLIELIVVVTIIVLLAALVMPQFIGQAEKARSKAAMAQVEALGTALDMFRLDVGRYPTTQEGLVALRQNPGALDRWGGPYLKKDVPLDPWGKPYIYKSPGDHGPYDIVSYGADGVPGGEGDNSDIGSW